MKLDTMINKGKRLDLEDLPTQLEAKIVSEETKTDRFGREALYITLQTKDNKQLTQKYTDFHQPDLALALLSYGYADTSDANGKMLTWKLTKYRMGNPRLIPIPKK